MQLYNVSGLSCTVSKEHLRQTFYHKNTFFDGPLTAPAIYIITFSAELCTERLCMIKWKGKTIYTQEETKFPTKEESYNYIVS